MPQITLKLSRPHAGQQRIRVAARRFNVVNCGRRFGKTRFGLNLLAEAALNGQPVAWFAPSYRTLMEPWREVLQLLTPVIKRGGVSKSEYRIELITGGVIEFWSLLHYDNIRGRKYGRALIDEAATVRALKVCWEEVVRPMLTDLRGDAFFFSTPRGRNYFWELFQRGQDVQHPDWMSWQLPTNTNPYIHPDEIAAARRELPSLVFRQEFLAEFLSDGSLFRRVVESAIAEASHDETGRPRAQPGRNYVFGVDWGRENDYTVISVVDATTSEQVFLERFSEIDYGLQTRRLKALYDVFYPNVIVAEANNMGGPLIESLRNDGLPIQPFTTTNATKKELIDNLALAFEQGTFRTLNHSVQLAELLAFEQTRLPSGLFRYAAPGNGHDDTVMALALSYYAAQRPSVSGYVAFA